MTSLVCLVGANIGQSLSCFAHLDFWNALPFFKDVLVNEIEELLTT
ncbi:MAG: hypothetical protein ACKPEQ_05850 [Dolichospermum sp.]